MNYLKYVGIALLVACTTDNQLPEGGSGGVSQGGTGGTNDGGTGGTSDVKPLPPPPVGGSGGTVPDRKPPEPDCSTQFVSFDSVFTQILTDVLEQDVSDRPFLRYVTLTNRYNTGLCSQKLESDRWAVSKFFNSISNNPRITVPKSINRENTIFRIDLRDYNLEGSDWSAIAAANSFAVEFEGDNANSVKSLLGRTEEVVDAGAAVLVPERFPFMLFDSIVDVATVAPLYYQLLDVPATRDGLFDKLGVDVLDDLERGETVLAGTSTSTISQQERVTQRNNQSAGNLYYWESFDLNPDEPGVSAFANPIGFRDESSESEALFSLPNGLQAYVIFNADGDRLDESSILNDPSQNDNVMRAGISCTGCHPAGMVPYKDQVRQFALDNPLVVAQDYQDVLELYPEDLEEVFARDTQTYQSSLVRAGVPTREKEPILTVFRQFDKDVDLTVFAGDLHFPKAQLEREVARLNPALAGLDDGFRVDRDDLKGFYCDSLKIVLTAAENQPICRQ